jgi:tetratricopeptide (TPR) repeat protein
MARGLADARAKKLDAALAGFAKAADAATKVGGARGEGVARIARENAAQTLVMLGEDEQIARVAAQQGLTDLVTREKSLRVAFGAYDAGLAAYEAQRWDEARARFQEARQGFDQLGEAGYAARARKAAAWSVYNQLASLPTQQAYPQWQQLVEETTKVDDGELYTRTYAAAALAAQEVGKGDPSARLVECAHLAEVNKLPEIGARCHGALAEREGDLEARADHARKAYALAPTEKASVYALYVVAVDAYNAGRADLALELAQMAKPNAGTLAGAVDEVIRAAGGP